MKIASSLRLVILFLSVSVSVSGNAVRIFNHNIKL